jgi:hypothetical protein
MAVLKAMRIDRDRPGTVHLELEAIGQHFEEGDLGSASDADECAGYLSGLWGEGGH